jgi:Ca2+-binding EF-hand superfamily protein
MDSNGDGKLSLEEVFAQNQSEDGREAEEEQRSIFSQIDTNRDNFVDWKEFSQFFLNLRRDQGLSTGIQ